jgi:RNA polymerase sigma-70 factor (ECF subfamily)
MSVLGDAGRAEDVSQDVFLTLWRRPERFDASRSQIGTYLRVMARSRALDAARAGQAAGRALERLEVREGATAATSPSPSEAVEATSDARELRDALSRLPAPQREVLVMKVWGGLTFPQVGAAVGVSPETAASRYRYALARLREQLAEEPV